MGSCSEAWHQAAGGERSHLTFAQFARWASDAKIKLPVGVDPADARAQRPCRFAYGRRCPCANYAAAHEGMCECGHKSSAHLSDVALMRLGTMKALASRVSEEHGGAGGAHEVEAQGSGPLEHEVLRARAPTGLHHGHSAERFVASPPAFGAVPPLSQPPR